MDATESLEGQAGRYSGSFLSVGPLNAGFTVRCRNDGLKHPLGTCLLSTPLPI